MAREKQEWISSCCRDSEDKAQQSEEAEMDTGMNNQLQATCKRVTIKRKRKNGKVLLYIKKYRNSLFCVLEQEIFE